MIAIKDVADISNNILEKFTKWHNSKLDIEAKIRLLYLECKRNLDVIDLIDFKSDTNIIQINDFKNIINSLETGTLELIFLDGEMNTKYFKKLKKSIEILEEDTKDKPSKNGNILQSAMFIYNKIITLKKLTEFDDNSEILASIKFKLRLNNIHENLLNLLKKLKNLDEIRPLILN